MIRYKISFLLFIMILFLSFSCQDTKITDSQVKILDNLDKLLEQKKAKSYKGKISTFVTVKNELGIKLKGNENKIFILQKENIPSDLNLNGIEGDILSFKSALVIGIGQKTYYLGLDSNKQSKDILSKIQAEITLNKKILGYGLTEVKIENFDIYNFSVKKSIFYSLLEPHYGEDKIGSLLRAPTCMAGGEGATSCSATSPSGASCSTSCGSGYYACCNAVPLSCGCVASGP